MLDINVHSHWFISSKYYIVSCKKLKSRIPYNLELKKNCHQFKGKCILGSFFILYDLYYLPSKLINCDSKRGCYPLRVASVTMVTVVMWWGCCHQSDMVTVTCWSDSICYYLLLLCGRGDVVVSVSVNLITLRPWYREKHCVIIWLHESWVIFRRTRK